MGAFERKDPVARKVHLLITLVEHFGDGKEFHTELRTCFLTPVDDPPLPVIVRMDVRMGEFHYVCVWKTNSSRNIDLNRIFLEKREEYGLFFVFLYPK